MDYIWKFNQKNMTKSNIVKSNIDLSNIFFCSYCLKYVNSIQLKSILNIEPNINTRHSNSKINDSKCYLCQRYLIGILNGPDIIKFINMSKDKNIQDDHILLNLAKVSVWYYNDIEDDFAHNLKQIFKFNNSELINIYQAINNLKALPSKKIINEKILFLMNQNL